MSGRDSIGDAIYASPRVVTRLEDCFFYHSIEIPGYGLVEGPWDLRASIGDYLGGVDLCGKRVLELGTASGFVCLKALTLRMLRACSASNPANPRRYSASCSGDGGR